MKNIVMLSAILAVASVPRYLYAGDLKQGDSDGCLVDSSLKYQRFYYCGKQSFGCAKEKHNNGDYSVCNDGTEVKRGNDDNGCYLTSSKPFTTRSGDTFYCCNGTNEAVGKIQFNECQKTGNSDGDNGENSGRLGGSTGSSSSGGEGNNNGIVVSNNTGSSSTSLSNSGEGNNNPFQGVFTELLDQLLKTQCDTSDIRNGFCPSTNSCVKCPSGKYFNEKDSANGCCSYAIGLTKTDMMYGYGKTQNSNPRLRNQCWTIKDIARYRACVLSGVQKPTTIKVPIQSAMDTAVENTVSEK